MTLAAQLAAQFAEAYRRSDATPERLAQLARHDVGRAARRERDVAAQADALIRSVWVSTRATPRFDTVIPSGRSGWAKYYNSGVDEAFLGATINLNQNSAVQTSAFNEGHSLHKLSYTTAARYTIPILPPAC